MAVTGAICSVCGKPSPATQTDYTLISSKHGWRVTSERTPEGKNVMRWSCAECWALRKKTPKPV